MVNAIDPSLMLSTYKEAKSKSGSNILGKDDFLKLLITQLQNQDPTNPMNDTEFIAQMATFSTLEQMTNMNSTLNQLVEQGKQSQLITYHQLIGQHVSWQKMIQSENGVEGMSEGSGTVTGVQYKDGQVLILLEDGTELAPENVTEVKETVKESALSQASMMIGKTVTYLNGEGKEQSAVIQSVSFKNGKIAFHLDDDVQTVLFPAQMTKISS